MRSLPTVKDLPTLAGFVAGSSNGMRISSGSSGITACRCSHARNDSVQAARTTLVMLPPNAVLTAFKSAHGIEAKATARRLVSGALNTVCGTGPLIDDAAGAVARARCSRPLTACSTSDAVSPTTHRAATWFSTISVSTSVTSSPAEGTGPRLGSLGRFLAGSAYGPVVNSRGHMDAAPAAPSFSAGDILTANAHRPPDSPLI